jgi:hypothetical protein
MRWVPNALQAIIVAVLCYFALLWGFEGLWALIAPLYGLGDFSRSQEVYSIGRLLALSPTGLMRVAAFIATIKLAVALVFAFHLLERACTLAGYKLSCDVLEAGLILAAMLIVGTAIAPLAEDNGGLILLNALHLLLLSVATALMAIERLAPEMLTAQRRTEGKARQHAETARPVTAAHIVPLPHQVATPSLLRLVHKRRRDMAVES